MYNSLTWLFFLLEHSCNISNLLLMWNDFKILALFSSQLETVLTHDIFWTWLVYKNFSPRSGKLACGAKLRGRNWKVKTPDIIK